LRQLELKKIVEVIKGKVIGVNKIKDNVVNNISVDSRTISKGDLFFALLGDNFDGHDFIDEAIKKSALPAVADRKIRDDNLILVRDTLVALGDLAGYYRDFMDPFVIAITGSVGKTTTKEFLGSIFSQSEPTLTSFKNYNNRVGVPLNIFRLNNEKVAIFELATNQKGEIKILTEIVKPDIAIITGIGDSHLEAFKDRKGVFEEKMDIAKKLSGHLFINGDDKLLSTVKYGKLIKVGFNKSDDYSFKILQESTNGSLFCLNECDFFIRLPGMGALQSAILATSVALHYGIPEDLIQKGLTSVNPVHHRLEIKRKGNITIVDDTYNSNPDSLSNSVSVIEKISGRKIAVLGPMLELGSKSQKLHHESGIKLRGKIDKLIVIGKKASGFIDGFGDGVMVKDKDEALEKLKSITKGGDVILFKSSHLIHLETLVSKFEESICSISYTH
jgi:UDP-N-acetylmuramoyl-tripeptide--D-alanyl-D-alanine ligase